MTLVLLHPVGLDGRCFQFLDSDVLEDAVAYDLLWHGNRPEPDETPTLESYADDVVANVPGDLDIVGVSLGGSVAQYIAIRHPERVRSLVLAASTAGDGSPERQRDQEARAQLTIESTDALVEWAIERWFSEDGRARPPEHPAVAYARERLLRDDPRSIAAAWISLGRSDSLRMLSTVTAPTTVLHPDHDVAPLAAKQLLSETLPHARLQIVEGPHMIHLENPRAFSSAIREHLAWVSTLASRAERR